MAIVETAETADGAATKPNRNNNSNNNLNNNLRPRRDKRRGKVGMAAATVGAPAGRQMCGLNANAWKA